MSRGLFTIDEIVKATNAHVRHGVLKGAVKGIETDSRLVNPGDLFIAIKGERFDAHDFIADVINKGVRVVLVSRPVKVFNHEVTVLEVKDTVKAMGDLAHFHRMRFNIPIIAITGSAGKTTVKEMLANVLAKKFRVLYNKRSFNNHIGVPLTLFQLKKTHQIAVIECGTNQPGDIAYLTAIVRPTHAILTVIGESHLEKLKSLSGVFKEKWQLTKYVGLHGRIFLNADNKFLGRISDKRVVKVGVNQRYQYQATAININQRGFVNFKVGKRELVLRTSGVHQVHNALLVIACAECCGLAKAVIDQALARFKFPDGRGKIIKRAGIIVIDDAYNANPVSMRAAIDLLSLLKVNGRRVLVVGDMRELGIHADKYHQEIGNYIKTHPIDIVVTVGDLSANIAKRVRLKRSVDVFSYKDVSEAMIHVPALLKKGDGVLIKGSHSMQLEKLVHQIIKRD